MTKDQKCMLRFHEKKLVAQFLTRKMARQRMNENSENRQCEFEMEAE